MLNKIRVLVFCIVIATLLIGMASCSTPQPTATEVPSTNTPLPATDTPVPPTTTPTPKAEVEVLFEGTIVTFDGSDCLVAGPTELEVGVGDHSFLLINLSGEHITLWVSRLTEGRTYQELVDMQSEPGEWSPKPDWVIYDQEVGKDYLEDGKAWTYRLDVAGDHFIYVGTYDPPTLWYCAPIKVVEVSE